VTITQHETSIHHSCCVAIRIEGAQPRDNQHGSGMFVPQGIIIGYIKINNGSWRFESVKLHGPKLKAGGGYSTVNGRHEWYANATPPDWVSEYIEKYLPTD
jgi:hypothetical protein